MYIFFLSFWQHGLMVAQCVDLTSSTLKVSLYWTTANRLFRRRSTTAHGPSATWAKRFCIQQALTTQTPCTPAPVRLAQLRCLACQWLNTAALSSTACPLLHPKMRPPTLLVLLRGTLGSTICILSMGWRWSAPVQFVAICHKLQLYLHIVITLYLERTSTQAVCFIPEVCSGAARATWRQNAKAKAALSQVSSEFIIHINSGIYNRLIV